MREFRGVRNVEIGGLLLRAGSEVLELACIVLLCDRMKILIRIMINDYIS